MKKFIQCCLFGGNSCFIQAKNKKQKYNKVSRNRIAYMDLQRLKVAVGLQDAQHCVLHGQQLLRRSSVTESHVGNFCSDSSCLSFLY